MIDDKRYIPHLTCLIHTALCESCFGKEIEMLFLIVKQIAALDKGFQNIKLVFANNL